MSEISNVAEVSSEIENVNSNNFSEIKPLSDITKTESDAFWDTVRDNSSEAENTEVTRYMITKNESLEGDVHPITGVEFEKKIIENVNGENIEGVFPNFESEFDAKLDKELYGESDYIQFKECNKQLYEKIENDADFRGKFSEETIEQIKDGIKDGSAPDGYVWHHSETPGKVQLVDSTIHAQTGHTGGRTVWGGGNENR